MEVEKVDISKVRGRIFDIQKYSVHDGPGIRTIVFLKGCALKCRWCCNPESQNFEIQTMKTKDGSKTVGRDLSAGEVMKEVLKDENYYRRSGGGMTLSGGEMLLQPDFSEALLKLAKRSGINTAVESTGFARYETIARLLPYIDVYLLDIKHTDAKKHKEFTTQDNALILENAVKIAQNSKKCIVRVPTIPGFNDTKEEIASIARFAREKMRVEEINLLPYHRFGEDKYKNLGRNYLMGDVPTPTEKHMNMLKLAAEEYGLRVKIGG